MFEKRLVRKKYFNHSESKIYVKAAIILLPFLLSVFFIFSCDEVAPHIEDDNLITLSGTILDSTTNQPIKAAVVTINERNTFTDSLGKFSFDSLLAGTYQLQVEHNYFQSKNIELALNSNYQLSITLIRKLLHLSGIVTDSVSNQPIDSVLVTINEDTTFTDSQGIFNFSNLLPGIYSINFNHLDYYEKTLKVYFQPDSLISIELKKIELVDYFPLYIGKTWTYDYVQLQTMIHYWGKLEWIVDNITKNKNGDLNCHIRTIFNGFKFSYWDLIPDTTAVTNQEGGFYLTENENEISFRFHIYDIAKFDRFLGDDNPQIVIVDSTIGHPTWPLYERILKIERDVGINFYHYRQSVGNNHMNFRIELIE